MADDEKSPKNSSDKVKQEDGKHSLVTLKKAEPSENISIVKSLEGKSEEVLEKVMSKIKISNNRDMNMYLRVELLVLFKGFSKFSTV
nr:unnamed protein product [Callosobruchus chinensis]